ncbi:Leo1-like protein-domain-containing protein [Calycina marina]|uniref:Leo1-like protein-domain-containing protein n=1 Tax=Calycina marina TaxID=1763456 RepID=A0A9P7Z7B4_9HELO|nr:Leo1-like protein-domain-containing protein [Calycina marina]
MSSEDDLRSLGGDDLFGDESGDDAEKLAKVRELSDEDLDSGDDEERSDRAQDKEEKEEVEYGSGRNARILDASIWRHPIPKPSDGEFNSLRLPKFLGINPIAWNPDTFELPEGDHHTGVQSSNFTASNTALSTMRYRKNPTTGDLESNTVIHKWSDGSTTMSIGNEQYDMQTKPLAPPMKGKTYVEVQDSHQYIAAPSIVAQMLVVVGHMNNQYTVRANKNIEDDALERLQRSLAAATRGSGKGDSGGGPQVIANTEDPDLQKKRAEQLEKDRNKEARKRESAAERANLPNGPRRTGGLLSVDDLEEAPRGRRPPPGKKSTGTKRPRKRRDDYSDDEEEELGGRGRMDEYDEDDGFLVGSDEDIEEGGGDTDEEDELESEDERPAKKQKKFRPELGSDEDAPAEPDDMEPEVMSEPVARGRKRNVVEDDEDE